MSSCDIYLLVCNEPIHICFDIKHQNNQLQLYIFGLFGLNTLLKLFRLRNFGNSKARKSDESKVSLDMKQEPSAFELKDQGNKYFSIHKYDEAIQCYNKAIVCFILI